MDRARSIWAFSRRDARDLFVLVRDPRAAARSQVHHLGYPEGEGRAALEARIEETCVYTFIPWLRNWIEVSRRPNAPFKVHWLFFRDARRDPARVMRQIARITQADAPAMQAYADCLSVPDVRVHFGAGDDEAWRQEVGEEARERLWAACGPEIRTLLDLLA